MTRQLRQESCANLRRTHRALELKGGVVEGTVYDVAGLTELSKIPSREELLSKLLGSIQSPITNFARVIKQIAEQGGGEAAAAAAEENADEAAEAPAEAAAEENADEAAEAPAEAAAETAEAPAEATEE